MKLQTNSKVRKIDDENVNKNRKERKMRKGRCKQIEMLTWVIEFFFSIGIRSIGKFHMTAKLGPWFSVRIEEQAPFGYCPQPFVFRLVLPFSSYLDVFSVNKIVLLTNIFLFIHLVTLWSLISSYWAKGKLA